MNQKSWKIVRKIKNSRKMHFINCIKIIFLMICYFDNFCFKLLQWLIVENMRIFDGMEWRNDLLLHWQSDSDCAWSGFESRLRNSFLLCYFFHLFLKLSEFEFPFFFHFSTILHFFFPWPITISIKLQNNLIKHETREHTPINFQGKNHPKKHMTKNR